MKLNTERKQLRCKYFTIRKEEENPTIRRGIRAYVENIKEVRDGRRRFQELIPSFRKLCFEFILCQCHCSSFLLGCPVLGRKLDKSGDLRPLRVIREI
ncbi:hypothetical protein C1H46_022500 [Malus baccata]|uniref:Uncharacterized protein n=1 Tax=Malus baccata TaxID=106549 RepID=A0A540LZG9_MALBA|nr:hypothetical protein C1H46_022500 [Malus baccata]